MMEGFREADYHEALVTDSQEVSVSREPDMVRTLSVFLFLTDTPMKKHMP